MTDLNPALVSAPPVSAESPAASVSQPADNDVATKLRNEFAEIAGIATQAARLGVNLDAADAFAKGLKPDALRQVVLDELAARSAAADLVTAQPRPAAPGESPIIRRARERAASARA